MNLQDFTPYFVYGWTAVLLAYDLYAFLKADNATISVWFWKLPYRKPHTYGLWCFALGVLLCHLFPVLRAHEVIYLK